MVNTILIAVILGLILIDLISKFIMRRRAIGNQGNDITRLDQYTTECYLTMIQKMVETYTIYHIEKMLGDTFSFNAALTENIDNEDLNKINEDVQVEVIQDMSPIMRDYLFKAFGVDYIRKYIRTYTVSLIINYTKLSIEDIIYTKEKK